MQIEDIDDRRSTRRAYLSALGGAGIGVQTNALAQTTTGGTRSDSDETWPHPRYDVSGTGVAPRNTVPDAPITEKWRFNADEHLPGDLTYPVVVGNGLVYAINQEYFDGRTSVFAVDAETGELVWGYTNETDNDDPPVEFTSPVLSDGKLVIGTQNGRVFAFDAQSGDRLWTYESDDAFTSAVTPMTYDGSILLWSSRRLYALDAESGEEQWLMGEPDGPNSDITSASIDDGSLYVGTEYEGIHVLDVESGERIHQHRLPASVDPSPIVDGTIYSTSGNTLRPIDLEETVIRWTFKNEKMSGHDKVALTRPAVTEDVVIVGEHASESRVWALDRSNGAKLWTVQTSKSINEPVVVGETVLVSCDAGGGLDMDALYALDVTDGSVRWRTGVDGLIGVEYYPIVADGTVYLSFDHVLIALTTGDDAWPSLKDVGLSVGVLGALGAGGLLTKRIRPST